MSGRVTDLIAIPVSFWQRPETLTTLRAHDIGQLFRLLRQYAGISQTRLAIACDITQPKVSGIMNGASQVTALAVFTRISDGLNMPTPARLALGLAPAAPDQHPSRRVIPARTWTPRPSPIC